VGAFRLLRGRRPHLGAYTFVRARKCREPERGKPAWLYRSYPKEELEP
jgi:hypothetical protein